MDSALSRWIAYRKPRPAASLRLFCLPYAGGAASIYRAWTDEMPKEIEVCPVQLPGREGRVREKAFQRMDPLVEAVVEAILPYTDMPFAFFGHSMGAIISYEASLRLRAFHDKHPVYLLVSGRRAPSVLDDEGPSYDMPEEEFKHKLRELDGTPQMVLEHPELMELMLPLLRADFEAIETYRQAPGSEPLDCPVTGYGGLQDEDARRDQMEPWREVTRGAFRLRMFPGGHFFLHEHRSALIAAVAEDLYRAAISR